MKVTSNTRLKIAFSMASALLLMADMAVAQSLGDSRALLPGQRFAISAEDLPGIRDQAGRGDVEAIRKMVDHYLIYEADDTQGLFWLERLGDTGDIQARKDVIDYYARHPSAENTRHLGKVKNRWGM